MVDMCLENLVCKNLHTSEFSVIDSSSVHFIDNIPCGIRLKTSMSQPSA